jgi:hypothetical protein
MTPRLLRENDSRVRVGNAAPNLALVRKLALSILSRERKVAKGREGQTLQSSTGFTVFAQNHPKLYAIDLTAISKYFGPHLFLLTIQVFN